MFENAAFGLAPLADLPIGAPLGRERGEGVKFLIPKLGEG